MWPNIYADRVITRITKQLPIYARIQLYAITSVFSYSVCTKRYSHHSNFTALVYLARQRSTRSEVFLTKGVMKKGSKFAGKLPHQSAISIKLQSNFIEITLRHGCSPVNLLNISRTRFLKNSSGGLLLKVETI